MSTTAYTGLPGAGKSYEVVNGPILSAAKAGRKVWTNIPVNIDGVHVVAATDEHWYLQAPAGALIVIDECWRYWPSGMKADAIPEEQKEFFAMHRHRTGDGFSTDIVLVTQDLSQIASFCRGLVEKTIRMKKLVALGTRNRYRVDVYDGAVTGQKPPESRHVGGSIKKYDPEGFKRYQSHTQGGEAAEVTVDNRGNIFKTLPVIVIPLAVVAMIAVPQVIKRAFAKPEPIAQVKEPVKPVALGAERSDPPRPPVEPAPVPAVVTPPAPATPPPPKESTRWTLLGVIWKQDGTGLAMFESATGRRRVDLSGCSYDKPLAQWQCTLDGEVVSFWTGNGFMRMAQADTYQAKHDQ